MILVLCYAKINIGFVEGKNMIGYWNYTVLLTYISVILACVGIGCAAVGTGYNIDVAVGCLLTCGLLDMFDGKVARTKKDRTEMMKDFGIQIDSLSDVIAFGILPAMIGFALVRRADATWYQQWYFWVYVVILLTYVLFGLVRLGYFNALENDRIKSGDTGVLHYYTGLPITMASLIFPAFWILSRVPGFVWIYLGVVAVVGLLFVLRIKIPKPHSKKMAIFLSLFGLCLLIAMILVAIFA